MFVETSWPRKPGDRARLGTYYTFAGLRAGDSSCQMRFYYHMWGDHIGNLSVKVRDTIGGPETTLWIRNDKVGNYWARAEVVLSSVNDFQVHLGTVESFLLLWHVVIFSGKQSSICDLFLCSPYIFNALCSRVHYIQNIVWSSRNFNFPLSKKGTLEIE